MHGSLKTSNLLTVDTERRLHLPPSDWSLQQLAAGQAVSQKQNQLLNLQVHIFD